MAVDSSQKLLDQQYGRRDCAGSIVTVIQVLYPHPSRKRIACVSRCLANSAVPQQRGVSTHERGPMVFNTRGVKLTMSVIYGYLVSVESH